MRAENHHYPPLGEQADVVLAPLLVADRAAEEPLQNRPRSLPLLVRDEADARDEEMAKELAVERAIASIDQHLVEPLRDRIARDADGNPCIEAKIPQDIERDLAMPGGHIFHGDLEWPWAPDRARQWAR